jgi:hypothetical protein
VENGRPHEDKGKGPCDFSKELFNLTAVLRRSVVDLLAYLLGNRGDAHAMFLPEIHEGPIGKLCSIAIDNR